MTHFIQPIKISSLAELFYTPYSIFFVDVVGVLYDGIEAYQSAIEAINQAYEHDITLIFLSNNPRPSSISEKSLKKMGLVSDFKIVTSGDYTRWHLNQYYFQKKIYHFGSHCNKDILSNPHFLEVSTLEECDVILLTQFIEENENDTQFDELLTLISNSHKPILCANPDIYALYGNTMRKCAGFFAKKIEALGGSIIYLGKPNPQFYEYACKIHQLDLSSKRKMLMIGDTLYTDIEGALNFEIDSLLVLSGISHDFNPTTCTQHSPKTIPTYYTKILSP